MHYFNREIRLCSLIIVFISFCSLQIFWQISLEEMLIYFFLVSSIILLDLILGQGIAYPLIRPSVWFGFGHYLFMVVGALRFFFFIGSSRNLSEKDLSYSMTLVMAAALLFQVGYYFSSKIETASTKVAMSSKYNFISTSNFANGPVLRVLSIILSLTVTGFFTWIFNLTQLNPVLYLLYLANVLASILALSVYFELIASRGSSTLLRLLLILTVVLNFIGVTLVVSRYMYFYIIAVGCILFYHRKVVVLKGSISYISFALFAIVIYVLGSFTKTLSMSEVVNSPVSDEWLLRLLTADFLDAFDNFSRVLVESQSPGAFDITSGSFLLHPFVNIIPRTIWLNKPQAFSIVLGEKWFPYIEGLSLAPSLIGELVANFGVPIALAVYSILGFLFRRLDKLATIRLGSFGFLSVFAMASYFLFMVSRGDFLLSAIFVYLLVSFTIIWWLISPDGKLTSNLVCGKLIKRRTCG